MVNGGKMIHCFLIGCGRIGKFHAEIINQNKDLSLDAICDINREQFRNCKIKTKFYRNYEDIPINEEIGDKLAIVATPNGTHFDIARYFVMNRIPVLIEKPLTINYSDANMLVMLANASNVPIFAVLQVRYNKAILELKKAIEDNILEGVYNIALCVRWNRGTGYFSGWRGTKELDGGTLLNQGIHYVDVLQWIFGMPESLSCYTDTVNHPIETEDEAFAVMKWKNGIYGTMEFTVNTYRHNLESSLTVLGRKGTIRIGGKAMNEIEIWDVEGHDKPKIETANGRDYGSYQGSCPNHEYIYDDVISHLMNGTFDFIHAEKALESLKLITAMYQSSYHGGRKIILDGQQKQQRVEFYPTKPKMMKEKL